jgi:hypothetical protein
MGHGSGVDQEGAKAALFQQFKQGDPVDAGGLHRDGLDAAASQPVGEGLEVGGEGPKPADRLGIPVGGDANPMDAVVDVDSGGVGILNGQGRARLGRGLGRAHEDLHKPREWTRRLRRQEGTQGKSSLPNGIRHRRAGGAAALSPMK